jgi:Ca2+-binding RTX toxin-like protein
MIMSTRNKSLRMNVMESNISGEEGVINLPSVNSAPNTLTTPFAITGTEDNDLLLGVTGDNLIKGLGGNDTINTFFGGNDTLEGGDGDDSFVSGSGNDSILGGNGSDFVLAGTGNDFVDGGNGNDFISGEDGDDVLRGGNGDDRITGDAGNDVLYGGSGRDVLFGFSGDDTLFGEAGDDRLFGSTGNDVIYGGNGNDLVNGDTGNDQLFGENGNDILTGVDTFAPQELIGQGEIDTLTGGRGKDTFALGAVLTNGRKAVFYNDGNPNTPGLGDYGLIKDFTPSQDTIRLVGNSSDYSLGQSSNNLPKGTGIFLNGGSSPELIGIIADTDPAALNLGNTNQFTFV